MKEFEVLIILFKETGKYKTEISYKTQHQRLCDIWDEAQEKLVGFEKGFATVDVPDHPNEHPRLLFI